MKQYNTIKAEVESWRDFSRHLQDTLELAQLDDEGLRAELEPEISGIETELEKRSFKAMLSGKRTLEDIAERVVKKKIEPQPRSGRQELLENIVNRYV